MVEDLLDDHRVFNTGNDVHGLTTKQTLKYSCFNDRIGSQVAVGRPLMKFIV